MSRFRYSGVNWEGRRWITADPITQLGQQIEARWEARHSADGTASSKSHDQSSPRSDHRPRPFTGEGIVRAIDVGIYLDQGERLFQELRKSQDSRIKYCIFQDRIFSSYDHANGDPYTERPYSGTPHSHHIHVSTLAQADNDNSKWDIGEDEVGVAEDLKQWIMDEQETLNEAGFDAGEVDGINGPNTKAARLERNKAAAEDLEDHVHDVARKTKGVSG